MSETERLNMLVQPLIPMVQAGDQGALDRLVRVCQKQIYRWALSRTADSDDADEVTQLVLIRLAKTLGAYRGESGFSTWLYRLTGNVAIDIHRGHVRKRNLSERETERFSREQARLGETVDARLDEIHTADVAELVRVFFEDLPERQREIFDLIDLQGFTPAEVSRMLEMNAVTVRANLLKARRAIRRRIIMEVPELQEEVVD